MAYSSADDITTEDLPSMYSVVEGLDREDGSNRWRQTAMAAYELSYYFHFGTRPARWRRRRW